MHSMQAELVTTSIPLSKTCLHQGVGGRTARLLIPGYSIACKRNVCIADKSKVVCARFFIFFLLKININYDIKDVNSSLSH